MFPEHSRTDYAYGGLCVHPSPERQGFSTVQPKKPNISDTLLHSALSEVPVPAFENHTNPPLHNNRSTQRVA